MYGFSQALIECNDSMHVFQYVLKFLTCIAYSLFIMQNGYMFFDFFDLHAFSSKWQIIVKVM